MAAVLPPQTINFESEIVLAYHGPRIYEALVALLLPILQGSNEDCDTTPPLLTYCRRSHGILLYPAYRKRDIRNSMLVIQNHLYSLQMITWDSYVWQTESDLRKSMCQKGRSKRLIRELSLFLAVPNWDLVCHLMKTNDSIPSTLKKQLLDDGEFVSDQDKLIKLPRSPTVDEILTKYLEYRSKKVGMVDGSSMEFFKVIKCYFDKAFPVMLLHKMERDEYNNTIVDNVSSSTIYGAEHLLRLFGFCRKTRVLSFFRLMTVLKYVKEKKAKRKLNEKQR